MPIGTIIGFLAGAFLTSAMVLMVEAAVEMQPNDLRHQTNIEMAKHRCNYIFWCVCSLCGLIGTFIEMSL